MSLQKASFKNLETQDTLVVQFNPAELAFSKGASYAEIAIPGLDAPLIQYVRGNSETLSVELFFDSTEAGTGPGATSVSAQVDGFYALVKQDRDLHAPPRCLFSWGHPTAGPLPQAAPPAAMQREVSRAPFWFTGIVESLDRRFTLFSPQGVPLRARLSVRMREYKTVEQMVAELKSADHTKARILRRRERLDQLAAREFGDPAQWRRIAEFNGIEDPRRVAPGTHLELPPLRPGTSGGGSE